MLTDILRRGALPAAAIALFIAAPASAQDPISVEQQPFTVSSHGDTVVWSSFSEGPGLFELKTLRDGQRVTLPVNRAPRAFDVDLGTSRTGSTIAVYTRCAKLPTRPVDRGTRCDLYRLDPATGVEEKLTKLSAPRADESQPTVLRGEIAFVRREGRAWHLRIGNTTSGSKGSRLLVKLDAARGQIVDPQLSHNRIAYTVISRKGAEKTIHVRTLRTGSDRTIYRARSGGANFADVTRPSWSRGGSQLYFARTNEGSGTGNRYIRWSVRTGDFAFARGTSRAQSTSWVGGQVGMYVAEALTDGACKGNDNDPNELSTCRLVATGPLTFRPELGGSTR